VCELAEEKGVLRGANDEQRGQEEGVRGFICSRWARCRVLSSEMIGGFGRCAGDGVVVSVQRCSVRSSSAWYANGQKQGFSRRAGFSCHGREDQVAERAGQVWRVARASMPCRVTCDARGKGACTLQNSNDALRVQTVHERGQGAGWGVANGRRGQQPSIGRRR
jgi:hypothetical protein